MPNYQIIRGADNEIEFQGLRGKYVYGLFIALGVVLLGGLLLFVLLPSPTVAGVITVAAAAFVIKTAFQWNKKYGRWGLEKKKIQDNLPGHIIMARPLTLKRQSNGQA